MRASTHTHTYIYLYASLCALVCADQCQGRGDERDQEELCVRALA